MSRRGFTLVELLVAMVVGAMLGVALTRMLISDSRFVSRQDAMLNARATARAAMNAMTVELRMTSDSGLIAAAPESVTVRLPYVFGIACNNQGADLIAVLMPVDSLTYAGAVNEGLGWRNAVGQYELVDQALTVAGTSDTSPCDADSIRVVPGGSLVSIGNIPGSRMPTSGSVFYLFHTVTYAFAPSVDLPGQIGLWRRAGAGAAEEIAAPFDTTAGFAFLVGDGMTTVTTPPGDLTTVRGLEVRLVGASEYPPEGQTDPEIFQLITKVPFVNRRN